MDKNTRIIEVKEQDMLALLLFRRKKQAFRAAREYKSRDEADKNASGANHASKAEASLAHTRKHGFKWCIVAKNMPVRS